MTNRIRSYLVAAAVIALPSVASAQDRTLSVGYTDIGAVIGIGGIGDAGLSFGGRFERVIREVPSLGNGTIGIQASVDMYSYDAGFNDESYRFIPIGVTANYHFNLENKKIVPFVGLGIGYTVFTCPFDDDDNIFGFDYCPDPGVEVIAKAGARYFFNEKMALYGDVGTSAGATLNVGLMFKLR
jgi:hypothetical protein